MPRWTTRTFSSSWRQRTRISRIWPVPVNWTESRHSQAMISRSQLVAKVWASDWFTPQQLELALRTIDELQMRRVPETLQDEAWPHYVHTLFLREGWRHMSRRYGHQPDTQLTKQMLVADLQSLRPEATTDRGLITHGGVVDGSREPEQSLQWLAELVANHLPGPSTRDMQEAHTLADRLVVEIGQRTLWMHGFAPLLHEHDSISESYFNALPLAQSAFKMALMQAAGAFRGAQRRLGLAAEQHPLRSRVKQTPSSPWPRCTSAAKEGRKTLMRRCDCWAWRWSRAMLKRRPNSVPVVYPAQACRRTFLRRDGCLR